MVRLRLGVMCRLRLGIIRWLRRVVGFECSCWFGVILRQLHRQWQDFMIAARVHLRVFLHASDLHNVTMRFEVTQRG